MRLFPLALGLTLFLATPAAAQTVAPPPAPTLLKPADGAEMHRPGKITFRIRAQPNEAEGTLGIELAYDDIPDRNADGSWSEDGPYTLGRRNVKPVEPGSDVYEVTISAKLYAASWSPGGAENAEMYGYWHAYRILPAESCKPIEGEEGPEQDCFQSTSSRSFHVTGVMETPFAEMGSFEPDDSRGKATDVTSGGTLNGKHAWLETRTDRDWSTFQETRSKLEIELDNQSEYLARRHRRNTGLVLLVYSPEGRVFKRKVAPGAKFTTRLAITPGVRYYILVRHPDMPRPARRVPYSMETYNGP